MMLTDDDYFLAGELVGLGWSIISLASSGSLLWVIPVVIWSTAVFLNISGRN